MDRRRVWPDFRAEHVLYEDDDLIAVHKPAGVSSQAAQPERPDDLVTRLKSFLRTRSGGSREPYLGVHQRLDRDTSGVVLFTKRPDVNAAVAAALEQRRVTKRYVAGVVGWQRPAKTTLDDDLAKGDDGTMIVVPRHRGRRPAASRAARASQRAVTHVTLRERRGERALLALVLETGRTHQARVQLAQAGAPIAGDPLYGGTQAPRLMLHAAALEIDHPRTKKRLVIRDDLAEPELAAWLAAGDRGYAIYDDAAALGRALALAAERRWGLGRSDDRDSAERKTTAFRLVNDEGDALPGLAVDVYGDHAVAQIYASEEWEGTQATRRERVLDGIAALGFDGVYLKLRPKQSNLLVDTRREDLAPKDPVRGAASPKDLVVFEEGVPFEVSLGDGLSTGIFLDQRLNRRAVREMARGARVANLFAYTCAFSVVAALGGAKSTVSVDASAAALEKGRAGFARVGVALGREHSFVADDAFSWLASAARREQRFDLVILDPPSYSSTKKRRFVAESDYDELVALAAGVVAPGGRVLACCNHRGMARQKLRRLVHEGARTARREVVQLKDLPDAPDFPAAAGRDPHMKSMLLTLR
jgi:23S rRNA (cytosine1962-C5)-methyltransferase